MIYLAVFGHFPRGTAATILALLLSLKIACGICLPLAQQRFLQGTGLLLLLITSLVLNIVIAFLHDLVPGILVSLTDAVGGIVVGIVTALKPPDIGGEAVTR